MSAKIIKLVILINDLSFFCSHRLPIAEAAMDKSIDVVIGYGELGGADPQALEQKGLKVSFVPMKRGSINVLKDLQSLFYIWRFFKKEKPDIAHLVTIKPYLYGGLIARLTGIPALVTAISGLGALFIHKDLKSKILKFLLYPLYRLAFNHSNQIVIVQNQEDAKVLRGWGVLNSNKVKLLKGSGVQLEKFINLEDTPGIPVVCFASRLLLDKGVYDFVSAARLLKKRKVQARFFLAGDLDTQNPKGINMEDLKKIREEGCVEILGYQKDIPSLYSRSHIICLPSYREGLPKTLLEAAAASRAVVTTDVPGCRDAIIPNITGLLVPVRDSEALANAIQDLIKHPEKRKIMGKAGRELAKKEFAIENIVDAHLKIYKDLHRC
ncbi:glycosyltransferase family 4 protein [Pelagibacteraceae bacterium]|nr:glycosyltransferase family 4 protein [Pelagibacteraceae bacterium]